MISPALSKPQPYSDEAAYFHPSTHNVRVLNPWLILSILAHGLVLVAVTTLGMYSPSSNEPLEATEPQLLQLILTQAPTTRPPVATIATPSNSTPKATPAPLKPTINPPSPIILTTPPPIALSAPTPHVPAMTPAPVLTALSTHSATSQLPLSPSAAPAVATAGTAPVATATATSISLPPAQTPAPAQTVEAPITHGGYLNNPAPIYPSMSRKLGERGTVKWKVLIGADGYAKQVVLVQSSGFDRLDQAAKEAILSSRYIPGKRGGTPEAMWYTVPTTFAQVE